MAGWGELVGGVVQYRQIMGRQTPRWGGNWKSLTSMFGFTDVNCEVICLCLNYYA